MSDRKAAATLLRAEALGLREQAVALDAAASILEGAPHSDDHEAHIRAHAAIVAPPRRRSARRAKPAPKPPKKKRRSSWAGLTPEQKLQRVNAIRKGRGLPPKEA